MLCHYFKDTFSFWVHAHMVFGNLYILAVCAKQGSKVSLSNEFISVSYSQVLSCKAQTGDGCVRGANATSVPCCSTISRKLIQGASGPQFPCINPELFVCEFFAESFN